MSQGKAYQRLVNGKLEWVYPGTELRDKLKAKIKAIKLNLRSRLETDDEVRSRLSKDPIGRNMSWKMFSGDQLDDALADYKLPARQWIEE